MSIGKAFERHLCKTKKYGHLKRFGENLTLPATYIAGNLFGSRTAVRLLVIDLQTSRMTIGLELEG